MKTTKNIWILLLFILTITGCSNKSIENKEESIKKLVETNQPEKESADLTFDKHLTIYKYGKTYVDSTLISEIWYLNDSIIKKGGRFYYRIPITSDFVNDYIIGQAKGKAMLETFDSLVCETGGTSVWNKYKFTYNEKNRLTRIEHYKAWWNEGLGESDRPEKPEYFLGERIEFEYKKNSQTQMAFNDSDELIETIKKKYDKENRLLMEHWDAWDRYRFKIYYEYKM
ncbi:MAG: hypothetical protein COC01_04470 [Bacteroidetes bacterium]|nr:hypothetical protein [Bacteroidia bacterium]PCH68085.1 MAG: hypothetical protein COC01_04470 [Bacteroidota bacterium]